MRRAAILMPAAPPQDGDRSTGWSVPDAEDAAEDWIPEEPLPAPSAAVAWPSAAADAEGDLRAWDYIWTAREGVYLTPREGEALARIRDGAWEVRADVAALLRVPRFGSDPAGSPAALSALHRVLWEGRRDLR